MAADDAARRLGDAQATGGGDRQAAASACVCRRPPHGTVGAATADQKNGRLIPLRGCT